ncbi:MAG: hypothetical protein Q7S59_07155 [Sulfurimonas sp.]|nr:hypothetical protein [Sulfurimonas sp.]
MFSKGRLWIAKEGGVEEFIVDPEYYGINYQKSWENITLEESLEQLNNPSEEYLKLATLNAAILLFITERASTIDEGYEMLRAIS